MRISLFIFIPLLISTAAIADTSQKSTQPSNKIQHTSYRIKTCLSTNDEKLIEKFQKYVAAVPQKVRIEALNFQGEKRALLYRTIDLYKILSKEAKEYIDEEDAFKEELVWSISGIIPEKRDTIPLPQVVIDDFKRYSEDVASQVYRELQDLREIKREKQKLYEGLSKEAREYLNEVQKFKSSLCNSC